MINVVSLSRHVSRWFGNYFHWDLYTEIIYIATPLPECCYIPRENYSQIVTFLVEITSSIIPIVRRSMNNLIFRWFYQISMYHLRRFIITNVSRRHFLPPPQTSPKKDSGNTGDKRTDAPRHYGHSYNCNSIAEISIRCFSTRVHRTQTFDESIYWFFIFITKGFPVPIINFPCISKVPVRSLRLQRLTIIVISVSYYRSYI